QARFPRPWALAAVIVGIVLATALLLVIMLPPLVRQGQSLLTHLPAYVRQLDDAAKRHGLPFRVSPLTMNWSERISAMVPQLFNLAMTLLSGITGVLTVAVLTIYLLIDGPRVGKELMRLLPREERLPMRQMLAEIGEQVGAYMRGQLLTSLLAGLFSYGLLLVFRVPEALALAVLMAVA